MKQLVNLFLLLLLLYFSWLTWFGNRGYRAMTAAGEEITRVENHNRELEVENQRLLGQIRRLRSDPRYQELVVRRELHMLRENELIFVFPEH